MTILNSTTALVGMPDDDPTPPSTPSAARATRPYAATDAVFASMANHAPSERAALPLRTIPAELDGALTIGVPARHAHALAVAADRAAGVAERAELTATELLAIVTRQDSQLETIELATDTLLGDSSHSHSMRKALEMIRAVSRERIAVDAPTLPGCRRRLTSVAEKIGGLLERGRRDGIAEDLLDELRDVLELATGGVR